MKMNFKLSCCVIWQTLGVKADGSRLSWPLKPTISRKMTSHNLVLAGDASYASTRFAGQGYNRPWGRSTSADCLAGANRRGLNAVTTPS